MKKNGSTAIIANDQYESTTNCAEPAQPAGAVGMPKQTINTLDFNGRCGNCSNPNVSMYGEGKWKCVCGAHS